MYGATYVCVCVGVYIQNMERVAAVINIQSDMCVYTECGDGSNGN